MKICVDFTKPVGKMKPMHAVGQPPILIGDDTDLFHYLTEAGIPRSRLHDVSYANTHYVDIPNIFRDFSADENDPASYRFALTDALIKGLVDAGVEPYFRLGVSIENQRLVDRFTTYPPKDFEKWARVCEHIIRHYNEGWADGFHYGIRYWEIWNEADDCVDRSRSSMWCGTKEEYFRLYDVTAKHLKACFGDTIEVGGYAATGVNKVDLDPNYEGLDHPAQNDAEFRIEFIHDFFRYIKAHESPLDFFSYHSYDSVEQAAQQVRYYDGILEKYGYAHAERHLNEWNACCTVPGVNWREKDHLAFAANNLAMMLGMQHEKVDSLYYYDAGITRFPFAGLFNSETLLPTNSYFVFHMFNTLYRLGTEVACTCDVPGVYALAATNGKRSALVLANTCNKPVTVDLECLGVDYSDTEVRRISKAYRYTPTGERVQNGQFKLLSYTCAEIRFY